MSVEAKQEFIQVYPQEIETRDSNEIELPERDILKKNYDRIENGESSTSKELSTEEDNMWFPKWFSEGLEIAKYALFTLIVFASILVILASIVADYCVLQVHPAVIYILLFAALTLLGYVEALHYSNVCVEKWDMAPYHEKFPRACEVQLLVNSNEKVQKFLVGRQFFVIFVVFIIAQCTTFPHVPKDWLGMPEGIVLGLVGSGLPGIMLTLNIGQLVPQLFVEEYTLPFMNLYGCYFVTQLSFFAEFIGVCNFSWLLFHSVDHLFFGHAQPATATLQQPGAATTSLDTIEANSAPVEAKPHPPSVGFADEDDAHAPTHTSIRLGWFDICKHIWSTFFTLGALFVVAYGISQNYSVLVAPVAALYIIFLGALGLLFYLEGLMICIVATQYWNPEEFKDAYPRAYMLHKMVNKPDVLKRFIVGRQFFTLCTNFLIAMISVFPEWPSDGYNPVLFFILIRSGLVGVMITLAFAQLLPELLAARHPVAFMDFYGSYSVVKISLMIESVGVGHCAWFLYFSMRGFLCGEHIENHDNSVEVVLADDSHNHVHVPHVPDHMPVQNDAAILISGDLVETTKLDEEKNVL